MLFRSTAIALALSLFACSFDSPAPSPSGSTMQNESGRGADDDDAQAASKGSIDGTWDITATGDIHAASAMMTVAGGRVSGDIVFEDEGTDWAGCTIVKHRWHFEVDVVGDELTGRYGRDMVFGTEEACPNDTHGLSTFTATRQHADANAHAQTAVEGNWRFKDSDGDDRAAMSVAGLVAQLYSPRDPERTSIITSKGTTNALTTTGAAAAYIFAARKR